MSQPAAKPRITRTSTCNCQKVSISVTGVDKGAVLCHCANCQRASGSAFAYNHRLLPGEVQFLKGKDTLKVYADDDTKSGNTLNRHFCGNCGCPMYMTNSHFANMVILHSGLIHEQTVQPKMELFPENKHSWVGNVTSKPKI